MGQNRDLFKKIEDTKGTFHAKMGSIKDRNGMDLCSGWLTSTLLLVLSQNSEMANLTELRNTFSQNCFSFMFLLILNHGYGITRVMGQFKWCQQPIS